MVGTYKGKLITATSTGMGCPSTAIAVEELGRCGVTSFIRVGSTAGLQPGIEPGDLIVSHGSLRNDGTSDAYVPEGLPGGPGPRADRRTGSHRRDASARNAATRSTAGSTPPTTPSTPRRPNGSPSSTGSAS